MPKFLLLLFLVLFSACRPLSQRAPNAELNLYADSSQLAGVYTLHFYTPQQIQGTGIGLFQLKNDSLFLSESFDTSAFDALCGRVFFDCDKCANAACPCEFYGSSRRVFGGQQDYRRPFGAQIKAVSLRIDSKADTQIFVEKTALKCRVGGQKIRFPKNGKISYFSLPTDVQYAELYQQLGGKDSDCVCLSCALPSIDSIARSLRRLP